MRKKAIPISFLKRVLKPLGPADLVFLTSIFNLSVKQVKVPAIWKSALVLPILKPGKPGHLGLSYRPISLMIPVIKILECLLLPTSLRLTTFPMQHGFWPFRSTTTALLPLMNMISEGFNHKKTADRTVIVALDL
jgi:hypothetical protein